MSSNGNDATPQFYEPDADLDTPTTRTPKLSRAQADLNHAARETAKLHEKGCTCTQCKEAKR